MAVYGLFFFDADRGQAAVAQTAPHRHARPQPAAS
jgi:hypothetical protein